MTQPAPSAPSVRSESGFADLVEELTNRLHAGEDVDLDVFMQAHPEHAERLARLQPALRLLADVSRSSQDGVLADSGPEREILAGTLGDFRIIREVGRGGMGIVYEAEQISLGRRVALKVLPLAGTLDQRHLLRFKNEAQAAAQLHHTSIVPVHFVGCDRGVHYYAMQFIDGHSLAEIIDQLRQERSGAGHDPQATTAALRSPRAADQERTFTRPARTHTPTEPAAQAETALATPGAGLSRPAYFAWVARLGEQAALALEHAHQMGVLHRDIKPGNLMLDGRGNLWVTDFGLAHVPGDQRLTMTGDLLGTLRYMSPEQALAQRVTIDQRTDVYSLGVTLYELLTLHPAYSGKDRQELLRQIAFEEPRPPRRFNKNIPPELETIVLKAMEKSPADRYATAQELAGDLRRYVLHEPIRARRSSLLQRARKVARRHPGVTVTAAVAAFLGLLLGSAGLAVNNWLVRQEQLRTGAALTRAEREKAVAQAVRSFLRDRLLAQADPRAQADALRRSGNKTTAHRPNPTIHELLDRAALELTPAKIEAQFPGQPLVQAEILATIGDAYRGIGEYETAIAHLRRARDLYSRELGPDQADTLGTIESLARTELDAGKWNEAAHLFAQLRDLRIGKLGPDHPDTLASMNNLARCYFALHRHAEALGLREDIVRLRKARLGPDDPDTLASMNNLANSYAAAHQFARALQLHQETLALREAKLGDHPDTLQSMNNVANCYYALGQYREALELHEQTLKRRCGTLGPDLPDTLQSMNNVAVAHAALGHYAEAIALHDKTLELRTAKLHLEHPDTLNSMNALA